MEFYTDNSVIFLTGATGFTGKAILEKVLRSLPQVKKVYLLVRDTKKTTFESRVETEISSSPIFETLRSKFANEQDFRDQVLSRVVPIRGDLTLEDLGMSKSDLVMVQGDTKVAISCGADTNWERSLRSAVNSNCIGLLRFVKVAQGMSQLTALVHISTAFVNMLFEGRLTKEEMHAFPLGNPEEILDRIEKMSEKELASYERAIIPKYFSNTYYASKALGEQLLQSRSKEWNLPVAIVRPSGIVGAISEPMPGWIEGLTGSSACSVLCGLGSIQEWVGNANSIAELVPVDWVCKTTLMAATVADRKRSKIPIFQCCTSSHTRLENNVLFHTYEAYWQAAKPPRGRVSSDIRCHMYTAKDFEPRFRQRFSEELTSALQENEKGLRRKLANAYRIPRLLGVMYKQEHNLDASNTLALDDSAPEALSGEMRKGINWPEYLLQCNLGIHQYLLKEKVDRNIVVNYTWPSVQRRFSPSGHQTIENTQDTKDIIASARL